MEPVYKTKLENSEEYKKFEKMILHQILDLSNYHLVVRVKVISYEEEQDSRIIDHYASLVFMPTCASSYQFMDGILSMLVLQDVVLQVTCSNRVSVEQ